MGSKGTRPRRKAFSPHASTLLWSPRRQHIAQFPTLHSLHVITYVACKAKRISTGALMGKDLATLFQAHSLKRSPPYQRAEVTIRLAHTYVGVRLTLCHHARRHALQYLSELGVLSQSRSLLSCLLENAPIDNPLSSFWGSQQRECSCYFRAPETTIEDKCGRPRFILRGMIVSVTSWASYPVLHHLPP